LLNAFGLLANQGVHATPFLLMRLVTVRSTQAKEGAQATIRLRPWTVTVQPGMSAEGLGPRGRPVAGVSRTSVAERISAKMRVLVRGL
jgi:hypothetical protein